MVHIVHFVMHGGIGPSTTFLSIHTLLVTNHIFKIQAYQPPFARANYMPIDPNTIAIPPRYSLGSSLPFMANLNLPNLSSLTNDPIHHDPL